jgi:hypothetical protein
VPTQTGWISSDVGLNLRSAATKDSPRYRVLAYGAQVEVLETVQGQDPYRTGQPDWYKISDGDQVGFIWAGGVAAGPVPAAPVAGPAVTQWLADHHMGASKVAPQKRSVAASWPGVPVGGGWDAVAQCESGGNYAINTGNGYYGGFQFDVRTWRSVGGSGLPSQASPAEQRMRAQTLANSRGMSPWPVCGRRY